jgi:hypothetical protein
MIGAGLGRDTRCCGAPSRHIRTFCDGHHIFSAAIFAPASCAFGQIVLNGARKMICSQLEVSVHMPGAPAVTLVEGGCGRGFHRGEFNRCVPDERVIVEPVPGVVVVEPRGRICPPGSHLGPEGRECRLNR